MTDTGEEDPRPPAAFAQVHCGPYGDDRRLVGWRNNVGTPVVWEPRPPQHQPHAVPALAVLSWNLWVGRGRLVEVVERIRAGEYLALGVSADLPLVVLVQEAYRADDSIAQRSNGWSPRELVGRVRPREDIVETARRLGLSLRYAPSMRNSAERSDRGNAILSTLPLGDAQALELPLVLQRRVAVATTLELGPRRLLLLSAHLDPRGPPGHKWLGAAGRALQTQHLLTSVEADTVILGADLNLSRGPAERTWRLLVEAGFTFGLPATTPSWRHTYHLLPRLILDYLLVRNRDGTLHSATVYRLDEDTADRGPTVFGSDHHPLLTRIEFL